MQVCMLKREKSVIKRGRTAEMVKLRRRVAMVSGTSVMGLGREQSRRGAALGKGWDTHRDTVLCPPLMCS